MNREQKDIVIYEIVKSDMVNIFDIKNDRIGYGYLEMINCSKKLLKIHDQVNNQNACVHLCNRRVNRNNGKDMVPLMIIENNHTNYKKLSIALLNEQFISIKNLSNFFKNNYWIDFWHSDLILRCEVCNIRIKINEFLSSRDWHLYFNYEVMK